MSGLSTTPRRLHPLTPLASAGRILPPVLFGLAIIIGQDLPGGPLLRILLLVGLSALVVVVVAGFAYVTWARTSYWFDDDGDLRIASGLLRRQERRVQLSRLQAVDLVQPIIARLIGLAELKPEMAGSGDSGKVSLAFLTVDQANELRRELLARAAGIRTGPDEPAPEAPERIIVRVPPRDLALSQLISESLILGVVVGVVVVVVSLLTEGFGALFGLAFAVLAPIFSSVNGFLANYDFTVAESPDGLRLRRGLLSTRSQTVPPGRVQAIEITQPFLWRRFGWVRLRVNVAGYGGDDDSGSESAVLLPVAPVLVANAVLARVLPGVEVEKVPLVAAPPQARRRSWWQYRRLAAGHDGTVFVARSGRLVRTLSVIPHVRTQSVRVTQGPWERALGLASMHIDSTPGPVTVTAAHRTLADATELATEQARRASAARLVAPPERWMLDRMRHLKAGRPAPLPDVDDERAGAS